MVVTSPFSKLIHSVLQQGQNTPDTETNNNSWHLNTYTMCQYCAKFFTQVHCLIFNICNHLRNTCYHLHSVDEWTESLKVAKLLPQVSHLASRPTSVFYLCDLSQIPQPHCASADWRSCLERVRAAEGGRGEWKGRSTLRRLQTHFHVLLRVAAYVVSPSHSCHPPLLLTLHYKWSFFVLLWLGPGLGYKGACF